MGPVHTAEGDAFAIAMIIVMFSAFGVIGLILFTIFRSAAKRNREVDDLIEEVSEKPAVGKAPAGKTPAAKAGEPWEKDGDWWKKE